MKAVLLSDKLRIAEDLPRPELQPGWAIIRVHIAGICRTDVELTQGYMGFRGVLGHEFVGTVEACADAGWIGKRVVGEINAACGTCDLCKQAMGRHCKRRSVLGIQDLNGCMAEYCKIPTCNLRAVPASLRDEQAIFVEPLSAAYEIIDQLKPATSCRCIVLGDGKLGILCAWALNTVAADVTLVGRHKNKLDIAGTRPIQTALSCEGLAEADLVVDATGSPGGLDTALKLCHPKGTIVLKTTVATPYQIDLAPFVIHEISLVGSRCGLFEWGLDGLVNDDLPVEQLIEARYGLADAEEAFKHASRKGALKVLLNVSAS